MKKVSKSRCALSAAYAAIVKEIGEKDEEDPTSRRDVFVAVEAAYDAARKVLGPPNKRIDEVHIVGSALWAYLDDVNIEEIDPKSQAGSWFEAFFRATLRKRPSAGKCGE